MVGPGVVDIGLPETSVDGIVPDPDGKRQVGLDRPKADRRGDRTCLFFSEVN